MKKKLLGYSTKEVDAIIEVLRKENDDLKRQLLKMDIELSRQKAHIKYLKTYYSELQNVDSLSQQTSKDESKRANCEIFYISKEG